jgi:putative transposase
MPRRTRIHLDGFPLHVVQRGHNRQRCFFSDADHAKYLWWLAEALREAECALHAYVLMTNHVHLLLTPARATAIPNIMMSVGRRYVHYINRKYGRTGTLWDSRYRSSIVQTDRYLLACQRYIELNPVRADMVADPAQYRWSSYRRNALGMRDDMVTQHPLYLDLGLDDASRLGAYRRLFGSQRLTRETDELRIALNQGQPFGDGRFLKVVEEVTGARREVRARGRPRKDVNPNIRA